MENKGKIVAIIIGFAIIFFMFTSANSCYPLFDIFIAFPHVFGIIGVIVAVLVLVAVLSLKSGASKSIGGKDMELDPDFKKMLILMGDNQPKEHNYQARKCPNCGAPIDPMRPNYCSFCRTKFTDTSKDARTPIHHMDYNPTRFYDENFTGYNIKSGKGDRQTNNSEYPGDQGYYDDGSGDFDRNYHDRRF